MKRFLRNAKLTFTSKNSIGEKVVKEIQGGGTNARIAFDVQKEKNRLSNVAVIRVYNLTDETIEEIQNANSVTLEAGYHNSITPIFKGLVKSAITEQSKNRISSFYCISGGELAVDVTIGVGANSTLRTILIELEKKLCEIFDITFTTTLGAFKIIDKEAIDNKMGTSYKNGYVFQGTITKALDAIARACDCMWYFEYEKGNPKVRFFRNDIQGNKMTAVGVISTSYGMVNEVNHFNFTTQEYNVINISTFLDPEITMGKVLRFDNSANYYNIKRLRNLGDTHKEGDNWQTEVELYSDNNK